MAIPTERSQEEIVDRIQTMDDFMGFRTGAMVTFLKYEQAEQFLKGDVEEQDWEVADKPPEELIKEYMEFAWKKANGCRGISANRSVAKIESWLWLDGKGDLADELRDYYEYYGKPCLVLVCEEYDIDWREYDDGRWRNSEDQAGKSAEDALRYVGLSHLLEDDQKDG